MVRKQTVAKKQTKPVQANKPDKFEIHNELAKAWIGVCEKVGNVAQSIRSRLTSGEIEDRDYVAQAAGELFNAFGRQERIKGTDERTPTTPFDSFNTQVQRESAKMGTKLKPEYNEDTDEWKLVEVKSRMPIKSGGKAKGTGKGKTSDAPKKSLSLIELRALYVQMLGSLTVDQKEAEIAKLRQSLHLDPVEKAPVIEIGTPAHKKAVDAMNKANARKGTRKAKGKAA